MSPTTWNPVALVTGAGSGIGRATTELIVARGGRVIAVDRDHDALAALRASDSLITLLGNVTSEQDNTAAVALAEETWGRLDVLILNAGVRASGSIESVDLDVFDQSIAVNLRSAVLGLRAGIPALRRAGGGAVVMTGAALPVDGGVTVTTGQGALPT